MTMATVNKYQWLDSTNNGQVSSYGKEVEIENIMEGILDLTRDLLGILKVTVLLLVVLLQHSAQQGVVVWPLHPSIQHGIILQHIIQPQVIARV